MFKRHFFNTWRFIPHFILSFLWKPLFYALYCFTIFDLLSFIALYLCGIFLFVKNNKNNIKMRIEKYCIVFVGFVF